MKDKKTVTYKNTQPLLNKKFLLVGQEKILKCIKTEPTQKLLKLLE